MGYRYVGGIGAIFTAFFHGVEKAAPVAFSCTGCGACVKVCPLEIDVPSMIEKLRQRLVSLGYAPPPHLKIAEYVESRQNPFGEPVKERISWLKELEEGCY